MHAPEEPRKNGIAGFDKWCSDEGQGSGDNPDKNEGGTNAGRAEPRQLFG